MQAKVIQNIRQQTKRLISQLQQLQQNKEDLQEQQYNDLKSSTLEDLKTFQKQLENMQKGDKLLASQIQKSKEEIMKACRDTFNMQQITNSLLSSQAKALRQRIKDLDKDYHLGKYKQKQNQYIKKKRGIIVQLQDSGVKLSQEQSEWLDTNHFSSQLQNNKNKKQEQNILHMDIAQKNINQLNQNKK